MPTIALVYALYGDADQAKQAARSAIESRLAACANILAPCLSIYRWEGATQFGEETPVLFKTLRELAPALAAHLREAHDYDIPAISHWEAETSETYARWIEAETRQSGRDKA
jgi:periplasmic divalent cation tolerance protein